MEWELLQSPMISYRSLLYSTTILYDIYLTKFGQWLFIASVHVGEYEQQSVELREIGVAKDKWENDRRRLEDELKKKDEQIKTQEKELIKSRST